MDWDAKKIKGRNWQTLKIKAHKVNGKCFVVVLDYFIFDHLNIEGVIISF